MFRLIIGIFVILFLVSFLSPAIREYLNEGIQNLFFKEAKERARERKLIGSVDVYSPRVEETQEVLKKAGFSPGPIDGRMGWQTRKAIREFQEAKGLRASGIVNQETWLELNREKETLKKEAMPQPLVFPTEKKQDEVKSYEEIAKIRGPQEKVIKQRLPKDRKKQIQIALQKAGFYKGRIDGKLGSQTKEAIREFQKANGLKPDGIVGKRTAEKLSKYLP